MRGFFYWKIILTILITFGILLAALSSHPSVRSFFSSLKEKIPLPEEKIGRNVSFSLSIDKKTALSFDARKMNITIEAKNISGNIANNKFSTDKRIVINNFAGSADINETVQIKGSFESIQVEGFLFVNSDVDASGAFSSVSIDNLALDKLALEGSGEIIFGDFGMRIKNQKISLEKPEGRFVLGNETRIEGVAKRILIGEKFVIG